MSKNTRKKPVSKERGGCLSTWLFLIAIHGVLSAALIAYLRTQRLNRAQELFRGGSLNISEVGQKVGYPIIQHFSAVFKKNLGLTPREYVRSLSR